MELSKSEVKSDYALRDVLFPSTDNFIQEEIQHTCTATHVFNGPCFSDWFFPSCLRLRVRFQLRPRRNHFTNASAATTPSPPSSTTSSEDWWPISSSRGSSRATALIPRSGFASIFSISFAPRPVDHVSTRDAI